MPDARPPYSMPVEHLFTDAELQSEFEYRRTTPYDDPSLAVLLPTRVGWKWVPVASDVKVSAQKMVPLARAEEPADPEVAVEMKYLLLDREVGLREWVDWFLARQGMFPLGGQVGTYFGRRTVDALVEYKADDGRPFVARLGFYKTGNLIWMTAGAAPAARYERFAHEFALAITRATPLAPPADEFAEALKDAKFRTPRKLAFAYPDTWTTSEVKGAQPGVGALDLFWGARETPKGLILVRLWDRERHPELDVERVTWSVFEQLRESAPELKPTEKLQVLEAATELFPGAGRMVVYATNLDGVPCEIHELILERKDLFFSVHLVTAPREKLPLQWMINRRAWEIVGMKLRLEE